MLGNRFDLEEYAKIKPQEMLGEVQAARGGRGLGLSLLVAAGAALVVVAALLLTLPPSTALGATDTRAVILQWQSPIRAMPGQVTILVSARDRCVFLGAGSYERDFTLRLPGGRLPKPMPINACTPEMPLGSHRR